MPDITMCASDVCCARHECYRHEAKPSEFRQSYSDFYSDEKNCSHFIRFEPRLTESGKLER